MGILHQGSVGKLLWSEGHRQHGHLLALLPEVPSSQKPFAQHLGGKSPPPAVLPCPTFRYPWRTLSLEPSEPWPLPGPLDLVDGCSVMLLAAGWSGSPLDRCASWEWQPQCPVGNPKQTAGGRGPAAYRLGCGAQGTGPPNTALPGPFLAFLASGPNGQPTGWRPASRPFLPSPSWSGFLPLLQPRGSPDLPALTFEDFHLRGKGATQSPVFVPLQRPPLLHGNSIHGGYWGQDPY